MRKILALCALMLAAVSCRCNCNKQPQTASEAASEYSQHLMNGDYGTLADVIVFMDDVTVSPHPDSLRSAHHADISSRGGIREIIVVAENVAPDGQSAQVPMMVFYNDGSIEAVNYSMVNHNATWKIAANSQASIWTKAVSDAEARITSGSELPRVKQPR